MNKISYKEREKRRREQEILSEAGRLIQQSGFTDLNMDMLAEVVGISKPTLYQHFKSKDDLIAGVLVRGLEELETHLESTSDGQPLDRLTMALRMLLRKRYTPDGVLAGVGPELLLRAIHFNPEVIAHKRRVMALVATVAEEGKSRGEIIADIPTVMVRGLMFNLMGCITATMLGSLDDDLNLEDAIEHVIQIFTRAVAAHR